ncbi:MAG: hypothetical protein AMJ94_10910 [Deltaproteobacteria bacterium SM23_61]|nr:MAG: hypothetical protein AMJ94_10910 [Deltaproteobacteria bacterium SM23_61]
MAPLFFSLQFRISGQKNNLSYHPVAPGAIHNHSNSESGVWSSEFTLLFFHSPFAIPHSAFDVGP